MDDDMVMVEPCDSYDDALIVRLTVYRGDDVVTREWQIVSKADYIAQGARLARRGIDRDDLP